MNRHRFVTKDTLRSAVRAGEYLGGWWVDLLPTQGGGCRGGERFELLEFTSAELGEAARPGISGVTVEVPR
jgi:hypothetical protein